MALGLTPEHLELAAAVRGWAERHCPVDVPRAASGQPDGGGQQYRDTLGPSLAAQGVLGLHLPEKHGGQGYGLPELAVATEELGRALLPGAFLPTVWASAVLASTGLAAAPDAGTGHLLTGLADGSLTGAVALAAGLTGEPDGDGGLVVRGTAGPVLGGSLADVIVAPVAVASQEEGGEERWAVLDAASLDISVLASLDLTRPVATVSADGVTVPAWCSAGSAARW